MRVSVKNERKNSFGYVIPLDLITIYAINTIKIYSIPNRVPNNYKLQIVIYKELNSPFN